MVKVNDLGSPLLAEAVVLWTGWGRELMPSRDDSVLTKHFGADLANQLLPSIKSLEEEFCSSDAKYTAASPAEMEKMAVQDFKKKHPEIADEIAKALAWCYTFDFR